MQCSDVKDGWTGQGNINTDPLFTMNGQFYWDDFRLQYGSPCIDAGSNPFIINKPDALDVDGDLDFTEPTPDSGLTDRIKTVVTKTVDMGAWEK